MINSHIYQISV